MEAIRCRFLDFIPPSVQSISILGKHALVLLESTSINLYSLPAWGLVISYPITHNTQLSKVIWHSENEFIAIGKGIYLYRKDKLFPVSSVTLPGVNDLCKVNEEYAVVCQDGSFALYEIESPDISQSFLFNKQDPLTSVVGNDTAFYTSSVKGAIVKWTKGDRTSIDRAKTGSTINTLLLDDVLVSGEDSGTVIIWDLGTLTQLKSLKTHSDRILCVVLIGNSLFASGTDSKITKISRVNSDWVNMGKVRVQSHEIRTLAHFKGTLYSAGVNTDIAVIPEALFQAEGTIKWNAQLECTTFIRTPVRHVPTLPFVSPVIHRGNHMLFNNNESLDLWEIDIDGSVARNLLSISSKRRVLCCTMTEDCEFLVFSNSSRVKMYSVSYEPFDVREIKNQLKPAGAMDCSSSHFFSGCRTWEYYNFLTHTATTITKFESIIRLMKVQGKYCAVVLSDNKAVIAKESTVIAELPTLSSTITALGFSHKNKIFLATEDNRLHGFNLNTLEPDPYTQKFGRKLPKNFLKEVNRIINIQAYGKTGIILNTHYSFTCINFHRKPPKNSKVLPKEAFSDEKFSWQGVLNTHPLHTSRPKQNLELPSDLTHFAINKRFGPIMSFYVHEETCFVNELDWHSVIKTKPAAFISHKYCT